VIKISYRWQDKKEKYFTSIKIQGHANSAPKGKDLICAAVSAIVNGTINFLQNNYSQFCQITCDLAEIKITIDYLHFPNQELQLCLKMFFFQLKNLADSYPHHINFVLC